MSEFTNFDLVFQEYRDGVVRVEARYGDDQSKLYDVPFPLDGDARRDFLRSIEACLNLRATRDSKAVLGAPADGPAATAPPADPAELGRRLYGCLFVNGLETDLAVARALARKDEMGMRLRLVFSRGAASLATLPWELLRVPDDESWITLSPQTPVVRSVASLHPVNRTVRSGALRVLLVVANPLDDLDVAEEVRRIRDALDEVCRRGEVELEELAEPTWPALEARLRDKARPVHVIHFIGHGDFDETGERSILLLESGSGEPDPIPAETVADHVAAHGPASLVVLNTCEGAKGGETDLFSSAAARLAFEGVNAVVAMTHEITDVAAVEFATAFYRTLAGEGRVDLAVQSGRTAIRNELGGTLEWATPALFLRMDDGRLFEKPKKGPPAHGGEIVHLLDRVDQSRDFDRFLDAWEERPDGIPRVVVLPARDDDKPDSFLERLIKVRVDEAQRRVSAEGGLWDRPLSVAWPDPHADLERRKKNLVFQLEEKANQTPPVFNRQIQSAAELADHPAFLHFPVVAIRHELRTASWSDQTPALVDWYVNEFWGELADHPDPRRTLFLVFLRVIYPEPEEPSGGVVSRLMSRLSRKPTASEIRQKLQELLGKGAATRIPTLVLADLPPIRYDHVKTWWEDHLEGEFPQDPWKEVFGANGTRAVPLADVWNLLEEAYQEHNQQVLQTGGPW